MTKSSQEQYEVLGRRMAPVLFAMVGLELIFVDLSLAIQAVLATLCGILLLLCSIGIWTRKKFGWYAGLFAYPIGTVAWLPTAFSNYSPDDKPGIIMDICAAAVAICLAGFWPLIWRRQKAWFLPIKAKDQEASV